MSSPNPHNAAQALSMPVSPGAGSDRWSQSPAFGPSSPTSTSPDPPLPWTRRPGNLASRRLSSARFGRTSRPPALRRLIRAGTKAYRNMEVLWERMTPFQRFAFVTVSLLINVLVVLFLVFSHAIFAWLAPVSHKWRALPGGWLIAWALVFVTAFPPIFGYSTSITIAGFVYGFPLAFPIVATANVAGSLACFYASRTVLSRYVQRLVGHDHRFVALGQVLRKDGLGMLVAVRFCPLPYAISNGFLATIPSIRPVTFAVATALASPKLLVHVFIGSRLALIAEQGDEMSTGDKIINYTSMFLGGLVGLIVGWLIYHRTMARAAELALEEANAHGHGEHEHLNADDDYDEGGFARGHADFDYADVEAGLVDPDDVAALMEEDDISLWANDGMDSDQQRYRDDDAASLDSSGNAKNRN